jgi:hypothetical protein
MTKGEREHRAKYIRMSMLVDKFIFEELFKGIVGFKVDMRGKNYNPLDYC